MILRLSLAMTLAAYASLALAGSHLMPTFEDASDNCLEQPPEPAWMQDIGVRESHNRLLVQQIYRAQSMQRIVEAKECSCATRYPPWDAAQAIYYERYGGAEYRDVIEATSDFRREANVLRVEAMPICQAEGNW